MLTPNDIQTIVFDTAFRGYQKESVDEFLDQLTLDYQSVIDENLKLRQQLDEQNKVLNNAKRSETSVMNTLEQAKRLMSDISESAEKRAEVIIKNARMDAATIVRNAKDEAASLKKESEDMRSRIEAFRSGYRTLLNDEVDRLDGTTEDLLQGLDTDYVLRDVPESTESAEEAAADLTRIVDYDEEAEGGTEHDAAEENDDGMQRAAQEIADLENSLMHPDEYGPSGSAGAAGAAGAGGAAGAAAGAGYKRKAADMTQIWNNPAASDTGQTGQADDRNVLTTDDLLNDLPDVAELSSYGGKNTPGQGFAGTDPAAQGAGARGQRAQDQASGGMNAVYAGSAARSANAGNASTAGSQQNPSSSQEPTPQEVVRESVSRDTLIYRKPGAQQVPVPAEEVYNGSASEYDTSASENILNEIDRQLETAKTRNTDSYLWNEIAKSGGNGAAGAGPVHPGQQTGCSAQRQSPAFAGEYKPQAQKQGQPQQSASAAQAFDEKAKTVVLNEEDFLKGLHRNR